MLCQSGEKVVLSLLECNNAEFSFEPLPNNFRLPEANIHRSYREILLVNVFQSSSDTGYAAVPRYGDSTATSGSTVVANPISKNSSYGSGLSYQTPQYKGLGQFAFRTVAKAVTTSPIPAFAPPARSKRGWISSLMDRLKGL